MVATVMVFMVVMVDRTGQDKSVSVFLSLWKKVPFEGGEGALKSWGL